MNMPVGLAALAVAAAAPAAEAVRFEGCVPAWSVRTQTLVGIELGAAGRDETRQQAKAAAVRVLCTPDGILVTVTDHQRGEALNRSVATDGGRLDSRNVALVIVETLGALDKRRGLAARESGPRDADVPALAHAIGISGSVLRFSDRTGSLAGGDLTYEARIAKLGVGIVLDAHRSTETLDLGTAGVLLVGATPFGAARFALMRRFTLATTAGPSWRWVHISGRTDRPDSVEATTISRLAWGVSGGLRAQVLLVDSLEAFVGLQAGFVLTPVVAQEQGRDVLAVRGWWQALGLGLGWRL